jgi:hypothetical protein
MEAVKMDKRQAAYRKWKALLNLTVERGCTMHEADTAKRLADLMAKNYGFAREAEPEAFRPDFDARWKRAEQRAAMRWRWEYRSCGKAACHCMRELTKHGPYKYGKVRKGRKVSSVYLGR